MKFQSLIIILVSMLLLQSCLFGSKKRTRPYADMPEYSYIDIKPDSTLRAPVVMLDSLDSAAMVMQFMNPDRFEEDGFMADDPGKKKTKKAKQKRNVHFGLKTNRGVTNRGMKNDETVETFSYLAELPPPPNPYLRDYWWYDLERKEVSRNRDITNKKGYVLHGPYERSIGGNIVEQGQFYKGLKHGRWVLYNRDFILQDKLTYYMGWPMESQFSYHDSGSKVKEIVPVEYGEREGNYYLFHDNGQLAVSGQYRFNQRVGVWTEYYRQQRRTKRQIQYSPDPFDRSFQPYIIREYDERGNLIFEREGITRPNTF